MEYIYNKLKLIEQEKILVEKNVIINEIKFMKEENSLIILCRNGTLKMLNL